MLSLWFLSGVLPCAPVPGWQDVAESAEGKILLMGEVHGTNEMPALFAEYVCHVSRKPGRTVVGVEIDEREDATLQLGFASASPEEVWRRELDHFRDGTNDGRSSEAVLKMLLRLYELRESGRDIEVRAVAGRFRDAEWSSRIDGTMDSIRFAAEAANLVEHSQNSARTVVLHGNVHAARVGRQRLLDGTPAFDESRFVRLGTRHAGGAAYLRRGTYAVYELSARTAGVEANDACECVIALDDDMPRPFDGWWFVGSLTPSPPVTD